MLEAKADSIITFPSIKLYQVCRKTTKEESEKRYKNKIQKV